MKPKLRIGLLCDNKFISNWQFHILTALQKSEYAAIILIIETAIQNDSRPGKKPIIYKIHERIDRSIYKGSYDYNKKHDLNSFSDIIPKIPLPSPESNSTKFGETRDLIREYCLDVILNFTSAEHNKSINQLAKYGIWSFILGDHSGPSLGYWEVVREIPVTHGSLQISLFGESEKITFALTGLATQPNSIYLNRNQLYSQAPLIIPRKIQELFNYDHSTNSFSRLVNNTPVNKKEDLDLFNYPTNFSAFINLLRLSYRFIIRNLLYKKIGEWRIKFKFSDNIKPKNLHFNTDDFRTIPSPSDRFWADPFIVSSNNYHYFFVEEFLYRRGKGQIAVIKMDKEGNLIENNTIIDTPYHTSYPYIFESKDSLYMIPESLENNAIELYRCVSFPNHWKFMMNIMDSVSAVDTSVVFHNNKWWLFTCIDETYNQGHYFNDLFLFYSDDLLSGNWKSHPLNPVISDIKVCRPAGRIFKDGNSIFRPSQDCSGYYGRALNFNQIMTLNETEYEEILVNKVSPDQNSNFKGTHTYNSNEFIEVIDVNSSRETVLSKIIRPLGYL
jgi:hypothetical protein